MLYLPPGWGHDGVAVGACITASIGFRAPAAALAAETLSELPRRPSTRWTRRAHTAKNALYADGDGRRRSARRAFRRFQSFADAAIGVCWATRRRAGAPSARC